MAMTVSSRVTPMPRKTGAAKRYLPTSPHWKRPSVWLPRTTLEKTRLLNSMAMSTRITAADTQRPGCLTGTTFIEAGTADPSRSSGPVGPGGSVIWWSGAGLRPFNSLAPLIVAVVTAPAWTPHLVRIFV